MRVTIKRDDLADVLGVVAGAVPSRTTIPILANVLLSAQGERLSVRGTDLDMEVDASAPLVSCDMAGRVTVPASVLHTLAKKFPAEAEIGLTLREGRLRIACGRAHYDLPVLPADDFPEISAGVDGGMPLDPGVLKHLLARVRFAMSTEETRFYLQGVFLHREGERLVAVATDGHVLARDAIALPPQTGDFGFKGHGAGELAGAILPRAFVAQAMRLLPDDGGEDCYLSLNASRVALFLPNGVRLVSKLIDGTYPDYKRVIPAANPHTAEMPHGALTAAIERAAVMVERKGNPGLKLAFGPGRLVVSAYTAAKGGASEVLDIVYDGPPLEIGVNAGLLLNVLGSYGAQTVFASFSDAASAMTWRDSAEPGEALAVLMPMRIGAIPAELERAA